MKKINYYFVLHIALLIFSLGSIASKLCSNEPFLSKKFIIYFVLLMSSLVIYAFIWQIVLKKIPLMVAYSNKGITIIWSMLIGYLFFKEKITISNILGALIIIFGIILIQLGGKENE